MTTLTPVLSWAENRAAECVNNWREDPERLEIDDLEPAVLAAIGDAIREAAATARAELVSVDLRMSAVVHSSVMKMLTEPRNPFVDDEKDEKDEVTTLRAQLAATEKEREEAANDVRILRVAAAHAKLGHQLEWEDARKWQAERDTLAARVGQLEGALDESDGVVLHMEWCRECGEGPACGTVEREVAAIHARAGLDGKEGNRG